MNLNKIGSLSPGDFVPQTKLRIRNRGTAALNAGDVVAFPLDFATNAFAGPGAAVTPNSDPSSDNYVLSGVVQPTTANARYLLAVVDTGQTSIPVGESVNVVISGLVPVNTSAAAARGEQVAPTNASHQATRAARTALGTATGSGVFGVVVATDAPFTTTQPLCLINGEVFRT